LRVFDVAVACGRGGHSTAPREVAMTSPIFSALLLVAVLTAAAPCTAEPRPDPLDAATPVPALRYRSSLDSFRALGDDKPVPWQEANDTTARIGGWRVYAREARVPAPAASAPLAGSQKK
jgi:hypothetical protein